jgi:ribosomal protein S18 acetylase RimI-like enzyme
MIRERGKVADAWFAVGALDGRTVAVCHGMQARERDGEGDPIPGLMHLSMIAVEPECWGRGYGRRMTEFGIAHGIELGYEAIQLWTQATNSRAQRLYQSLGFVPEGRVKIDRGESIGLYCLVLKPGSTGPR